MGLICWLFGHKFPEKDHIFHVDYCPRCRAIIKDFVNPLRYRVKEPRDWQDHVRKAESQVRT